jgi:hypothetical protein
VLHHTIARLAVFAGASTLPVRRAKAVMTSGNPAQVVKWKKTHPEVAGYAAWLVINDCQEQRAPDRAMRYLAVAMEMDLHLLEPRLMVMGAEAAASTHGIDTVVTDVEGVPSHRTTDDGYDELTLWLIWTRQALTASARNKPSKPSKFPRLSRPRGRVPQNPYAVRPLA